jgi:RHS repeat-associated protein
MTTKVFAVALLLLIQSFGAQAQTIRYIHTDGLGSVVLVTDASRNVVERREYEPYGAVLTGIKDGPGYAGHVTDAQTGLTYMQQRYYEPSIGRFLSVDPVTAYDKSGGNFNRYWYGNNNPYGFIDPDGRQTIPLASRLGTEDPVVTQAFFEAQRQQLPLAIDFVPGAGDVKGFVDAYNDPSVASITAAVVGLGGPLGDGAAKYIKSARSAEAAADVALAAGKRAGAAAELRIGDRAFTGVSGEVVPHNPLVTGTLMGTPSANRAPWHGGCAEIVCLDKALNAGINPAGGTMRSVNIGVSGAGHNTPKSICSSCDDVLRSLGVSKSQ